MPSSSAPEVSSEAWLNHTSKSDLHVGHRLADVFHDDRRSRLPDALWPVIRVILKETLRATIEHALGDRLIIGAEISDLCSLLWVNRQVIVNLRGLLFSAQSQ